MGKEVRQGLGLLCAAVAVLLVSLVMAGQPEVLARGAGLLLAVGAVALIAVGLLRRD